MTIAKSHILFVDDDPATLDGLRRMLRPYRAQWEVSFVGDANAALERVRTTRVDAIVCDLMMPSIDGFALLETLHASPATQSIPVVMLTGANDRALKRRALDLGANDLLSKPIEVEDLVARVRSVLQLKAYEDELRTRNRELEQDVRARTAELADAQLELIWRLGKAAELRDEDTGNHVVRVGCYSSELAKAMGLATEFTEMLYLSSPLHDIGKIGIPDNILRKRGALDADEWEVMKSHCAIGASILRHDALSMQLYHSRNPEGAASATTCARNPLLDMAARIARWHHERWDGCGYPDGLAGEAIPLEARIVAVADAFDALTMERPYKPAYTDAHALKIMRRDAGAHFDPRMQQVLEQSVGVFREIRAKFADAKSTSLHKESRHETHSVRG